MMRKKYIDSDLEVVHEESIVGTTPRKYRIIKGAVRRAKKYIHYTIQKEHTTLILRRKIWYNPCLFRKAWYSKDYDPAEYDTEEEAREALKRVIEWDSQ